MRFPIRGSVIAILASLMLASALSATAQIAGNRGSSPDGAFLDVENGKIYYEECGTGPTTVVLIHDGIAHSAVWDAVWPAFCAKYRALRYDRRGYGKSPAPTDDLAALLRHLKVKHAALVGSSHGGELSIDFTLEHPDNVQELVLVGAVVGGLPYSDHFLNRGAQNSKPFEKNDVQAGLANWAHDPYLLSPKHETAQKKLLEILTASPQDMTHEDYARPTRPALPRLHEIRVPTLILTGDADIPDVHAHAGTIEAGIPNSRRVVLKDAGHLMYLEIPDEFTRVVTTFIDANLN